MVLAVLPLTAPLFCYNLNQPPFGGQNMGERELMTMKKLSAFISLCWLLIAANPVLSKEIVDAGFYFDRGNSYFNNEEYDNAIKAYSQAISIYAEFFDAYHNRGLAYYKKGKYEEAISDFSRVIGKNPQSVQDYNSRALAYLKTGQFTYAVDDYSKVISMSPNSAEAYHNRGIAYANSGKYDEAIDDYNKVISMRPGDMNVYMSRGVAYFRKAMADFGKACDAGNQAACDNVKQLSK
jgi:tetratricopeptide (TPR) repeat protein